jgi:hypothetical protein
LKVFASVAGLLFIYSAVVQLNDPDPVRWFALYGSAAVASLASLLVPVPRAIFAGIALVASLWAATLAPSVLSAASFTGNEEERELGGLTLVALTGAVFWLRGGRPGATTHRSR